MCIFFWSHSVYRVEGDNEMVKFKYNSARKIALLDYNDILLTGNCCAKSKAETIGFFASSTS